MIGTSRLFAGRGFVFVTGDSPAEATVHLDDMAPNVHVPYYKRIFQCCCLGVSDVPVKAVLPLAYRLFYF
jgi:hypothetical protein